MFTQIGRPCQQRTYEVKHASYSPENHPVGAAVAPVPSCGLAARAFAPAISEESPVAPDYRAPLLEVGVHRLLDFSTARQLVCTFHKQLHL